MGEGSCSYKTYIHNIHYIYKFKDNVRCHHNMRVMIFHVQIHYIP